MQLNNTTPAQTVFLLIHSPLVGPMSWGPVADALRARGREAIVPALTSNPNGPRPYWRQHVDAAIEALAGAPAGARLIIAGHSGGGMLLPVIAEAAGQSVAAYLFVDAGLPQDGRSRLSLFETPEIAEEFRQAAVDGFLPTWTDEDLREAIPDDRLRRDFVAELRPLPLDVYEEPIPVFGGWPDVPVRYLRFGENPAYDADAERARREGWPVTQMAGAHFQLMNAPEAVAEWLMAGG